MNAFTRNGKKLTLSAANLPDKYWDDLKTNLKNGDSLELSLWKIEHVVIPQDRRIRHYQQEYRKAHGY